MYKNDIPDSLADLVNTPDSLVEKIEFDKCLIDVTFRQYACWFDKCKNKGQCIWNSQKPDQNNIHPLQFHPEDKRILHDLLLPDLHSFMLKVPVCELSGYRFVFNHRFIKSNHKVAQFIQEGGCSLNSENSLVLNLKVFSEIGDIKPDDSVLLTIYKYTVPDGFSKVFSREYNRSVDCTLSARELEIIHLCSEGLSSKMIADKLNLSIHTVKNHKRNCMTKTSAKNIAELIHLAVSKSWI